MGANNEHVSRSSSVKRAKSISESLKGLFKPGSSTNTSSHTGSNTNIYALHEGREHSKVKSITPASSLPPLKTDVRRRKSLNDDKVSIGSSNTSKLSRIADEKVTEIQKTRTGGGNKQPSSGKPAKSAAHGHSATSSPPILAEGVPLAQSPELSAAKQHKLNSSTITPANLPRIDKLILSPSHSNTNSQDSKDFYLSEEELDQINDKLDYDSSLTKYQYDNLSEESKPDEYMDRAASIDEATDSAAPTPKKFSIDAILDAKSRSRPRSRSRSTSLKRSNSSSSNSLLSASNPQTPMSSTAAFPPTEPRVSRGRPHADTISASGFPRYLHPNNIPGSPVAHQTTEPACILQVDSFKVFSNGTHEHNMKTISIVDGDSAGPNSAKAKSGFSFSGFFKVGTQHNKNLDDIMVGGGNDELGSFSYDQPNFENALSLIPFEKRSLCARVMSTSSSDSSVEEDKKPAGSRDDAPRNKGPHGSKSEKAIPQVINPRAAVSSEELKLINSLSEKIHAGLKKSAAGTKSQPEKKQKTPRSRDDEQNRSDVDIQNLPFADQYGKIIGTIGHGAYGIVSVCARPIRHSDIPPLPTYSKNGKLFFGVKQLKPRVNESVEKFSTKITSEFIIGHSLSRPHKKGDKISPNILKIIDLMENEDKFVEVMEFCPAGDLYSILTRKSKSGSALHPLEADCFMKQLLHGIKFMHDRGVAHCDLKPENILFHPNGLLKICDFGTSCVFQTAWERHVHFQSGAMGSEPYVAPEEFIHGMEYDPRLADCWSIGVVYCTMVLGHYLWKIALKEKDGLYKSFVEEMVEENEFYVFEELRHVNHDINRMRRVVLYKIFHWNPEKRISIHQILQSPWMKRTRCCIPYKI
ncbi:protein kinase HAL5 KNAG_0C02430 [Huiozyma naganishii CBS 8797]|uniref:non-specific serine/threonine protein kinase n=1 Tax=Huiozyma naganishii (strain ATCC MYA-139 / BCRC 22969 / CBS 8797 / KCTC 17520 / NBRC 10181 / NCYC 3082 / Yp74L-3) TaxID=1071383 RepID=J7S4L4_HUIN7|nr:hypothetical protein KNAG_0C02430 [Kazachstania naganishii CBS 8797]CCK69354.1 hypothetical protein KNAG_0C02430 [Kazachstania naganishii CBS 8797]